MWSPHSADSPAARVSKVNFRKFRNKAKLKPKSLDRPNEEKFVSYLHKSASEILKVYLVRTKGDPEGVFEYSGIRNGVSL